MATEIKLRRGTKAQHDDGSGFTGALGEVTVDTTDDTLRVHDGSLKGGHVIAKLSDVQASDTLSELSDTSITSTAAGHILIHDGSNSFDNKAVSGAITINSSGVTALASGQALTNLGGGSGTTFLRKDGTFATPTDTNTTYSIQDGELSQNNFTDADHSKLNAIEASADVTDTANVVAALTAGTNISIAGDGTISSTDANTTYSVQDGELSQNSFTNDDHSKLNGIEASADVTDTTNVVAALTAGTNIAIAGNGTISATDTNTTYSVQDGELSQNNFTDADHTKLNGIEASADVTDATNVVAALTAGTNIAIAGNGTISSTDTNTQYTGGTGLTLSGTTFNVDAAQTGITSLGTLSGLTTGATTVNGALIVNNDTVDIVSTDSGATTKPTISLYRNSAGASAADEMGSIDFYGNNNRSSGSGGPEKTLYGSIYAEAVDVNTDTEDGSLKFSVANAGGVEDPIFSLFNYGIVMGTDNDLRLGQRGEIWFEGASNSSNETVLYCVDPTQENTVLLPDDSGTLSLDGENQTSYRTGEIIEVITGYADGSTLAGQATSAGAARNFALEDVTALQSLTTSYGKINGTLVNYLPPVGTKTLEIEYGIFVGYESPDTGIMHHKLNVGGTYVTNTRMTHRDDSALNKYVILKSILTVDGSGDVAAGNVDSWNSAIALQLDGREYGGSAEIKLHITHYYDGSTSGGNQVVVPPSVKITAIG
mgnify:CR=1 FL=1